MFSSVSFPFPFYTTFSTAIPWSYTMANFPSSILSRLVYFLQTVFLSRKLWLLLLFPFINHCYTLISNIVDLWNYKLIPLSSILIIPFLNHNFFHPTLVLMTGSEYHFRINLTSLIYEYLCLPKFWPCINYILWFLSTLPSCPLQLINSWYYI